MHLSPRDLDKLLLHGAGFLAQKRLARGLRLNVPEATALLATQVLELVRDGRSVAELMDLGRRMLGRVHVLPGVAAIVTEVQVEGTFPDGTKLVTVHDPIVRDDVSLELALYGSFLPAPDPGLFAGPDVGAADDTQVAATAGPPGEVLCAPGEIELNAGRPTVQLVVTHRGDRPIQVGSHFPFDEVNRALELDRASAAGGRLDIPAGTAVRFEPGETRTVVLVRRAGPGAR